MSDVEYDAKEYHEGEVTDIQRFDGDWPRVVVTFQTAIPAKKGGESPIRYIVKKATFFERGNEVTIEKIQRLLQQRDDLLGVAGHKIRVTGWGTCTWFDKKTQTWKPSSVLDIAYPEMDWRFFQEVNTPVVFSHDDEEANDDVGNDAGDDIDDTESDPFAELGGF